MTPENEGRLRDVFEVRAVLVDTREKLTGRGSAVLRTHRESVAELNRTIDERILQCERQLVGMLLEGTDPQ